MIAIVLAVALTLSSLVFWLFELNTIAVLTFVYVVLSSPGIGKVFYLAIKHREWPRVVGGPGIMWAGKSYNL